MTQFYPILMAQKHPESSLGYVQICVRSRKRPKEKEKVILTGTNAWMVIEIKQVNSSLLRSILGLLREAYLIRPMPVLQKTIDYLLDLLDQPFDERFLGIYNFLWDRMRTIRMDLSMQHIFDPEVVESTCCKAKGITRTKAVSS